jgi:alpha-beta hydrolase superfamily lysophospholipase
MSPVSLDQPEILAVLFHPRQSTPTPLPEDGEDITIPVNGETSLSCRFFIADPHAPVLIFFHGNGEILADYDSIGPGFTEVGLNFLVTEYRGYGWSSGTPSATTLLTDAEHLYGELRTRLLAKGYSGPFFVMGRSLGSACAIDLAARHNDDKDFAGLIIDSGFARTLPLARTLGLDPDRLGITEENSFNNEAKIARVTKPTLILHGREDQLIPLQQAEQLMAACGARAKELQVIPGADHNSLFVVGGPLYFQTIKRFVDKATGADDWRKRRQRFKNRQKKDE